MQFIKSLIPFLLAGLTIASPVAKRTAATAIADITVIENDVATLNSDALALTGTLVQCLAIYSALTALQNEEATAVSDTAGATWSTTDSQSAVSALTTLTSSLTTLLTNFDGKYTVLENAGYAGFVGVFFKTFASDTDAFYAQFITSLTSGNSAVTALKATVDAAFSITEAIYA